MANSMWFSMPKGVGGMTIQQIEFAAEVRDADGIGYFRAPPHFSQHILALAGFTIGDPPASLTDKITEIDPTFGQKSAESEAYLEEIRTLRENNGVLLGQLQATQTREAAATFNLEQAKILIARLTEQLEEKDEATPVAQPEEPPDDDADLISGATTLG